MGSTPMEVQDEADASTGNATDGRQTWRWITTMLPVGAMIAFVPAGPTGAAEGSVASVRQRQGNRPCADLEIDFFPTRVEPRGGLDFDFSLTNCSWRRETLTVRLRSTGACPSFPSSSVRYVLAPQAGFGTSALMFAPDCAGVYIVRGRVLLHGHVLDRSLAHLLVRRG